MNYSEYYLKESQYKIVIYKEHIGNISWECPSNIALIKYWGKKEGQLPLNPSLSFTLSNSITKTKVSYHYDQQITETKLDYYFENKIDELFKKRIYTYLKAIECYLPFLKKIHLSVNSDNTFPHSSGIASSASSFGALALCLLSIENELTGTHMIPEEFRAKASFLARLGSGSASRSIFGGTAEWGKIDRFAHSSDEIAISLGNRINTIFSNYQDLVLIIDKDKKSVSSSEGHRLMDKNPYAVIRIEQARNNMNKLINVLESGDLDQFIEIVENEALTLHSMMLTSNPGFFLVKQGTIDVIEKVRVFRDCTKIPIAFTLDAGANVHLLFPNSKSKKVLEFVQAELIQHCASGNFIHDNVGEGPKMIPTHEKAEF